MLTNSPETTCTPLRSRQRGWPPATLHRGVSLITHLTLIPLLLVVMISALATRAQQLPSPPDVITSPLPRRLRAVIEACDRSDWVSVGFALSDASPLVRLMAASCWDPTEGGLPLLIGLATDPDASIRTAAAVALGRSDEPQARVALISLLRDPVARVRTAAARSVHFEAGDEVVLQLAGLLYDTDLEVVATASRRLLEIETGEVLDEEAQAELHWGLALSRLGDYQPELLGIVGQLHQRMSSIDASLVRESRGDPSCHRITRSVVAGIRDRLHQLVLTASDDKLEALWVPLREMRRALQQSEQVYYTCLGIPPIGLVQSSDFSGPEARNLAVIGELQTHWEHDFGRLRADLAGQQGGGELWARSLFGLDLFVPRRAIGATAPLDRPSLAVLTRLRRDQLFNHDALSNWNGGGALWGRFPLACPLSGRCELSATVSGNQSTGTPENYPAVLIAQHDHLRGRMSFRWTTSLFDASVTARAERVRYDLDPLEPAGLDRFGASFAIDSGVQLRIGATRSQYPQAGQVEPSDEPPLGRLRDGTLLDGLLGIRFGHLDSGDILQVRILGGVAVVLLDDPELEVDPLLLTDLSMTIQNKPEQLASRFVRLRIGGRRQIEASPRDFALQAFTESYLDILYRGLSSPESGVQAGLRLFFDLLETHGPTGSQPEYEIARAGGGIEVRFFLEKWIGAQIADWVTGIAVRSDDFEIHNRFVLSLFVPVGGYAFGLEEPIPW